MYCLKCNEPLSAFGLLHRKNKCEQYYCFNCNTLYLKSKNGLIFPAEEFRKFNDKIGENNG